MIVLKSDRELNMTFQRLVQMMDVPVEWNGLFLIIGDYLILQGDVRSLFFNFDTRSVVTNIIDLQTDKEEIVPIEQCPQIKDVLNMVLYVFGKWGNIKGLRVEKDYVQLNRLFTQILGAFQVEAQYSREHFRFYRNKIRLTYEDVLELVLAEDGKEQIPEEEEPQGLWHKLIWKKSASGFLMEDITVAERRKNRIGNNFYLAGYLCPKCGRKLYLAVYPEGKEFRIETEEGDVLMARAYTCRNCCCFYTPRPQSLLIDGDVYRMDFEQDETAYTDYLELLGRTADRVVNTNYNEFADKSKRYSRNNAADAEERSAEFVLERLPDLSEAELFRTMRKMADGFYSDDNVEKLEHAIKNMTEPMPEHEKKYAARILHKVRNGKKAVSMKDIVYDGQKKEMEYTAPAEESRDIDPAESGAEKKKKSRDIDPAEHGAEKKKNSKAKNKPEGSADKTSQHAVGEQSVKTAEQRGAESRDIDPAESGAEKKKKSRDIDQAEHAAEKKKNSKAENKPEGSAEKTSQHAVGEQSVKTAEQRGAESRDIDPAESGAEKKKKSQDIDAAEHGAEKKKKSQDIDLTEHGAEKKKNSKAEKEPERSGPKTSQRAIGEQSVKTARQRGAESRDIDPAQYEHKKRQEDFKKLANVQRLVNKPGQRTREECLALKEELLAEDMERDLLQPYIDRLDERISALDEKRLNEVYQDAGAMNFEDAMEAYEEIENGDFLPKLKYDALKELEKRMSKIKTDECELLVHKLEMAMEAAKMKRSSRYHFYPAKKVFRKKNTPEEIREIENALESYASGNGKFEYPVFVFDKSREESGREGFLLTPEKIYYSAWVNSYYIPIMSVQKIEAMTGLLNRGIYVYQKNGTKTKLPAAAETEELEKLARVLQEFVFYLQEKPFSRKESYLAKEKHDTICCYRCGYVYKGANICPRCGYKQNE